MLSSPSHCDRKFLLLSLDAQIIYLICSPSIVFSLSSSLSPTRTMDSATFLMGRVGTGPQSFEKLGEHHWAHLLFETCINHVVPFFGV
ncbi:hypothetical protein CDAR_570841 [Caerostris darwini]|uniref:Uncharacterized protein n=1 Tax=Caerostris darwini TaxID=1538125 RepID=A0AAV4QC26_9ARAC|nr:hypothetical protein CDAR_570841 [Caerostris darwini]